MRNTTRFTIAVILLAAIVLLDGCNELNNNNKKGRQITFTSQTGEVGTKTFYGDDYKDGNTTWQYIVWEVGDKIRIASDNASCATGAHYADYEIGEVTANAEHKSYAKIKPTPNGLEWAETDLYQFYAVTPTPGTGAVLAIISQDDLTADNADMLGTVRCSLPATPALPTETTTKTVTSGGKTYSYTVYKPDMDYAVMTAHEGGDYSSIDSVRLTFKPAFTAFEFNLTSADEDLTVSKVELFATSTDDRLNGTYLLKAGSDISVSGAVQATGTTANRNSVSMTMSPALALTASSGITFTLFTVPIVNESMLNLRVTTSLGTATLKLTDTDKTSAYKFQPGKKYRVNLLKVGDMWKIFFEVEVDEWVELTPTTIII